MRRWLNMIAAGQPVRRLVIDAGLHAVAGLVDVLPDMRRRMATVRLTQDRGSWAAEHVAEFGGDRQRMSLAGESAGANLALSVLLACCTPRSEPYAAALFQHAARPVAALLYCGFLQTSRPERYRRAGVSALAASVAADAAASYLGAAAAHPGRVHELAAPLCVVEAMAVPSKLPLMFIAAGLSDPVAPDSQRLEQALLRLQSPCSAHYYAGEPHAFHVMFWRRNALRCWRDSFEYLDRLLPIDAAAAQRSSR